MVSAKAKTIVVIFVLLIMMPLYACSGNQYEARGIEKTTNQERESTDTHASISVPANDTMSPSENSIIGSWENTGDEEGLVLIVFTPDGRYRFDSTNESEDGTYTILGNNSTISGDDTAQVLLVKMGVLISYPDSGGGESFWRFEIGDKVLIFGGNTYSRVE